MNVIQSIYTPSIEGMTRCIQDITKFGMITSEVTPEIKRKAEEFVFITFNPYSGYDECINVKKSEHHMIKF